jgi:glucose/mannose-6-phosphate isomerase
MKQLIHDFPKHIEEALTIAKAAVLKNPTNKIDNVIICGMGGSGIGAKIVSNWVYEDIKIPVSLVTDYTLPAFASSNSLVIGSSYSGNTEETISALEIAKSLGAHIVCVCSGGKMEAFCSENDYDCILVPGGNPPRSTLAYSLVQLLHILHSFGLIGSSSIDQMDKSRALLTNNLEEIQTVAKDLSSHLYGKVGILYGETIYEGVIVRARQQFNENSKYLCWHHTIPEMNHNELVGWGGGDNRFAPVFFETSDIHPRNKKRFEITSKATEDKCGKVMSVLAKGESRVEQSLYLIHIVDWASYYLCEENNQDIIDIKIIDYLKGELSKF